MIGVQLIPLVLAVFLSLSLSDRLAHATLLHRTRTFTGRKLLNQENTSYLSYRRRESSILTSPQKRTPLLGHMITNYAVPAHCVFGAGSQQQQNLLQHHIKTVHQKIKDFECSICAKKFGHHSSLQCHIKTVHKTFPPPRGINNPWP